MPDRLGAAVGPTALLYRLYERRLAGDLRRRGGLPRHVGVIMDGNRRWARQLGMNTMAGHRRGADQIDHLLEWSRELGIPTVTLWLLSTDNLLGRHPAEASRLVTPDEIARHLYTAGVPDPDLIIRTSGEIRLSGFLLWQSAHAEYYFADAYWPDFRKVDFLRALRSYAQRQRRFGR